MPDTSTIVPSVFIRRQPLQALKLTIAIGVLAFGVTSLIGVLPGQGLNGLLYVAFVPIVLAVIVGSEALLAGYRLTQAEDPAKRLRTRRGYTVIRAIELVMTVGAPGIFYGLVLRIGSEVPGPGAIGLLFIGAGLGVVAYASVILRTLTEYYYLRKRTASSRTDEPGRDVAE